jgi:hypothetical protein
VRVFSVSIRVGSLCAGFQSSAPFVGIERVQDGASNVAFHIGWFPHRWEEIK